MRTGVALSVVTRLLKYGNVIELCLYALTPGMICLVSSLSIHVYVKTS